MHLVHFGETVAFETAGNMQTPCYSCASEPSRSRAETHRPRGLTRGGVVTDRWFVVLRRRVLVGAAALSLLPLRSPLLLGVRPSVAQTVPPSSSSGAVPPGQGVPAPGGAPAPAVAPVPPAAPLSQGQWMPSPDGRYVWVPEGYELPPVMPYREGQPVPPGYHLEERPIRAALITGYVVTAVPYFTGLLIAATTGFPNRSAFLAVPWAGPWLTLGLRENRCEPETYSEDSTDADGCIEDAVASMVLIFDGVIQAAGGTLVLVGYLAPQTKLVRDAPAMSFTVRRMGAGYGLSAFGVF